jgi:hypothetical protein
MSPRRGENSLEGFVSSAMRGRLLETHVLMPGVIEAFDPVTVRASVRIPLKRLSEDLDGIRSQLDWPLLTGVPVSYPHAGGFAITMPITIGDEVLVGFTDRDLSRWLDNHLELPPETNRAHDLADGVVLAGFNTRASQVPSYSATDIEIMGPLGVSKISVSSTGLAMTVGPNELMAVLEELCDVLLALQTVGGAPGAMEPIAPATNLAITAVKAKLTLIKG